MIFLYMVMIWMMVKLQAPVWIYILFMIGIVTRTIAVNSKD